MGNGGFRPAFNMQFTTTCEEQVIVGMDVVNASSDMAQLAPMVEQVQQRLGRSPGEWLVDGGFPAHEQIDAVVGKTEVYAPVPEPRAKKDEQGNAVQQDSVCSVSRVCRARPVSAGSSGNSLARLARRSASRNLPRNTLERPAAASAALPWRHQ